MQYNLYVFSGRNGFSGSDGFPGLNGLKGEKGGPGPVGTPGERRAVCLITGVVNKVSGRVSNIQVKGGRRTQVKDERTCED